MQSPDDTGVQTRSCVIRHGRATLRLPAPNAMNPTISTRALLLPSSNLTPDIAFGHRRGRGRIVATWQREALLGERTVSVLWDRSGDVEFRHDAETLQRVSLGKTLRARSEAKIEKGTSSIVAFLRATRSVASRTEAQRR